MQVEIRLAGKQDSWRFTDKTKITLGRRADSDLPLPFPMVSQSHAVLEIHPEGVRLQDLESTNGSYVNGSRVATAWLRSGDRLRLGVEGPELAISLSQSSAGQAATVMAEPEDDSTQIIDLPPVSTPATVVARGGGASVEQSTVLGGGMANSSQTVILPSAMGGGQAASQQPVMFSRQESSSAPAESSEFNGDEQVIEQKLDSIRTLLTINIIVLAVLLLGVLYEVQQVNRTRSDVQQLRQQAQSAVGQFTPELDHRLSTFDKRMSDVDHQMKAAEDRMVQRMNTELPAMLDKYLNKKLGQVQHQMPVQ
jgi:hypothetical protein